jgi:hypothetical protein
MFVQMTLKKVPSVKAKPMRPMMPQMRENGEVTVVDITIPIVAN